MINMDMENLNINTLDGPEWLRWVVHIQAMAGILDCWDVIKGEADGASLPDFLLLVKPSVTTIINATLHYQYGTKEFEGPKLHSRYDILAVWPDYTLIEKASGIQKEHERKFRKAGGALTYLQFISMIQVKFNDSQDLLPQIQVFKENHQRIILNGHSKISKDIVVFAFCSGLLKSYQDTAHQYLDNITNIKLYSLQAIMNQIAKEESITDLC